MDQLQIASWSLVAAAAGAGWTCAARMLCGNGQCFRTGSSWWDCSFSNVVSMSADLQYHNSTNKMQLEGLTRGPCGIGEMLSLSGSGEQTCLLRHPFPDALHYQLFDTSAATDHEQYCGKWLAAGHAISLGPTTAEYLALSGAPERAAAVRAAAAATFEGAQLASTNAGKLRSACQRSVLAGPSALRASAELAYNFLVQRAAIDAVNNSDSASAALGRIVAHYCDAPVVFGWELRRGGLLNAVRPGEPHAAGELGSALTLVREDDSVQKAAEEARARVLTLAGGAPEASHAQLLRILRGGTGRPETDDGSANLVRSEATPSLDGFLALASSSVPHAKAYLKGLAATCSFSLSALVEKPGYTARAIDGWRERVRTRRPMAASLGRLRAPTRGVPLAEADERDLRDGSFVTIGQLTGAPATDPSTACLEMTTELMPDTIDALHFRQLISPALLARMERLANAVRAGVAAVLRNNTAVINAISGGASAAEVAAKAVEQARIRVPGAPSGTWAGPTHPIPDASFDSSDGVFTMAAKQMHTLWLHRQNTMVFEATHPCEAPSALDGLTSNAYVYTSVDCVHMLLGLASPPYLDSGYDDRSIATRWAAIVAHELAHLTLKVGYKNEINNLLTSYPNRISTQAEAFADVVGVLGVLETGLANASYMCATWSQLWCALTPLGYSSTTDNTHPLANLRGDALCETLRSFAA